MLMTTIDIAAALWAVMWIIFKSAYFFPKSLINRIIFWLIALTPLVFALLIHIATLKDPASSDSHPTMKEAFSEVMEELSSYRLLTT